jgi:GT2 family glycosyltransferase
MDLCKRLGTAGWTVRYAPDAVAVHHGGASTGPRSAEQARLLWSSRILYHRKHATRYAATLLPPLVRAAYLARALWWSGRASLTNRERAAFWRQRAEGAWGVVRQL